jgi:signal transduction histidine kinase
MRLCGVFFTNRACFRRALTVALLTVSLANVFVGWAYADSGTAKQANSFSVLTDEEQKWLAENHTVRVRVGEFPPYQMRKPEPSGLSLDLLNAVADRYGFKVVYVPELIGWPEAMQDVKGPCQHLDLLLTMNRTLEREQQFALTQDYLSMPWVIYTRKDSPFISNIANLADKLVSVEKGYAIQAMLKKDQPTIRFLEEANSEEALHALATGRADAYVGNLAVGAYLIRQHSLANLVVAAPTPYGDHTQAMAIRKDWKPLASIIDKGIAAMPTEQRNKLTEKWTQVEVRPQIDYTLAWQILAFSTLLIAAFFYWNRRLTKEIAFRKATEAELAQHRDNLELLVNERTADLSVAKQRAEAANEAKTIFLANMSHELRTPMNGVMGMIDVALRRATDPKQIDMLNKSKGAAQRMVNVVNDIIDFSKAEADRLPLEEKNFSLSQMIDDAIELQNITAQAKGLILTREIPANFPDQLSGDAFRLRQILLNFLGNACKFSDQGTITVRVSTVEHDGESVLARIEVEDQGIGISSEHQAMLFQSFTQADGSMTRKYGGSGLGLIISKRLAKLMDGDVGVVSQEGRGSTFWATVRLKLGKASEVGI